MNTKKMMASVILTAVCALCAFALMACGTDGRFEKEPVYHTVTFYYNMGFEEDFERKSVESGKTAADKVPDIMSKSGYIFDGWCSDEALTQDYDIENTPVTSDISLYARWKKEQDRAWFLSKLGECAANAANDGVERTRVVCTVKLDGAGAENFASGIVNGGITVGNYPIRLSMTAEWLEKEFLNDENIKVTSEVYSVYGTDRYSATIRFVDADDQKRIYSFVIDKYGYVTGCSKKTDNGEGEAKTPLYVLSSAKYE